MRLWGGCALALALVLTASCDDAARGDTAMASLAGGSSAPITSHLELRDEMRRLWTERGVWLREALFDEVAGEAARERLDRNEVELRRAMRPFVGDRAADDLLAVPEHDAARDPFALDDRMNETADAMTEALETLRPDLVSSEDALDARAEALHVDLRRLWQRHLIASRWCGADLDEPSAFVVERALGDFAALADALGPSGSTAFVALLREHTRIEGAVLRAARNGRGAPSESVLEAWYANADAIAAGFARAVPAPPFESIRRMLRAHIDRTVAEAEARADRDGEREVAAYDESAHQLFDLADALSAGLSKREPPPGWDQAR
ncbi:MAG: hypothetical protein U0414_14525 [Polyangiaceae bacterium]